MNSKYTLKKQKKHQWIALFFTVILLPSLFPLDQLYASNGGPKSPEAASFEPVDATDMVNLLTGQFSYVLPLLNVPSPEGGYPIALSYHAGIGFDQDASWAGLGWNVNPGAVDRSINGYPDDYNKSELSEFFYDDKRTITSNYFSTGYTSPAGVSVGVGFNWGSHQATNGYVSVGVGVSVGEGTLGVSTKIGTEDSSISVGYTSASGLFIGATASNSSSDVYAGWGNSNGTGFAIGYNTSGTYSANIDIGVSKNTSTSIDFTLSSSGLSTNYGMKVVGVGSGMSENFNNISSMGDYSHNSGGYNIALIVPTPIGLFSLSFGQSTYSYWLNKIDRNYVTGPMYYHQNNLEDVYKTFDINYARYFPKQVCTTYGAKTSCRKVYSFGWKSKSYKKLLGKSLLDVYEIPLSEKEFSHNSEIVSNNLTFPNYDNFTVQSQGLSGSMSLMLLENGALGGLSGKQSQDGYVVNYNVNNNSNKYSFLKFNSKPYFYFKNEISSYIDINPSNYHPTSTFGNILDYYTENNLPKAASRRRTASYIEHFTNNNIIHFSNELQALGYLKPNATGFDRMTKPRSGIGAFKITAVDGKTYHYSLPVYNHETVIRTFGMERPNEKEAYQEKRQIEPYATHWLLTAVTGPDFVDNGDGKAGIGDLGYWVNFEYGKWTDTFVWQSPKEGSFIANDINPNIKTWVKGRKQLYYLDAIKTRTHTALFVKSEREDAKGKHFDYHSAEEFDFEDYSTQQGYTSSELSYMSRNYNPNYDNPLQPFIRRFIVPVQKQLQLDKVILIKNEDNFINKDRGLEKQSVTINYKENYPDRKGKIELFARNPDGSVTQSTAKTKIVYSSPYPYEYPTNILHEAHYNIYDNILDSNDNWENHIDKSLKVIDLSYDEVKGRNILRSVSFNGKKGNKTIPPYRFDYYFDNINIGAMDGWGFNENYPEEASLHHIQTPEGAIISVKYEPNMAHVLTKHDITFKNNYDKFNIRNSYINNEGVLFFTIRSPHDVGVNLGDHLKAKYELIRDAIHQYKFSPKDKKHENVELNNVVYHSYYGMMEVIQDMGDNEYRLKSTDPIKVYEPSYFHKEGQELVASFYDNERFIYESSFSVPKNQLFEGGGIRVSEISVNESTNTQNINEFVTSYKYGKDNNGVGCVSYIPYANNLGKELPYSAELPAPRVMYEYVTMSSAPRNATPESTIRYKFNLMPPKSEDKIKYGDIYEIDTQVQTTAKKSSADVSVIKGVVKDNLAAIGQLLEVSTINSKGQTISKITNEYYKRDEIQSNVGVIKESFQNYKSLDYLDHNILPKWLINTSTRITYPIFIKSSTEYKGGHSYTSNFKNYDPILNTPLEQEFISSNGIKFKTKSVPAYKKYNAMGSKVDNVNNKNMLSQVAAEYTYVYHDDKWKETSVGITTWNNKWGYKNIDGTEQSSQDIVDHNVWRKQKSYRWNGSKDGNGIFEGYNSATDDGFDWSGVGIMPSKWEEISHVALYNRYSVALEAIDINGNKAATKYNEDDTYVVANGNAGYHEMYYSSAENISRDYGSVNYIDSEVRIDGATIESDHRFVHNGEKSVKATNGSKLGVFLKAGRPRRGGRYKLSVWVHKFNKDKARVGEVFSDKLEQFDEQTATAGDWVLLTHYFDQVPSTTKGSEASNERFYVYVTSIDDNPVYYDDFKFHPVASSITGYVYNSYDELTFIMSPNGLSTCFVYDDAGRLKETYEEIVDDPENGITGGFKLRSKTAINYSKDQ